MTLKKLTACLPAIGLVLSVAVPAGAQQAHPRFVFDDHPSLRFGKTLRIDIRAKVQGDFFVDPNAGGQEELSFDLTRRRIGIEGTFLKRFDFQIERELGSNNPWRDVFVDARLFDHAQLTVGKFKVPFSLDQLTSPTRLDFVYRSRIGDDLAPGRDIGAALHGRFRHRLVGYDLGLFVHDGENARWSRNPGAGPTGAGRVTMRPFRLTPGHAAIGGLRDLEIGAGTTVGDVPEGLNALRGRSTFGERIVQPIYVNGRRVRLGLDASWSYRPFSARAEVLRVRDERREQGLLGDDLPPLSSHGWYASGSWTVTGESKTGNLTPRRPLFAGGVGAVEVAARYERIGFDSVDPGELPSRNPRSATLPPSGERLWTFGVNWYLNRWVKVQANVIREQPGDTGNIADLFWRRVVRLQFVL